MTPERAELELIKRKIKKRLRRQAKLNIKILVPRWLYLLLQQRRPAMRVMLNL
jgi:hypothetical protein